METTYAELHRIVWLWLSDNPYKGKMDWPGWENNGGNIKSVTMNCFACASVFGDCSICPLTFIPKCSDKNSYYEKWNRADHPTMKKYFAAKIANTSWVEKKYK